MDKLIPNSVNVHISNHQPRFSDGDPAGIVYFANYPMYFDESFIKIAKGHGFDWSNRDNEFIIPIVEQRVSYKKPLTVGQSFSIATAIIHIGNRSFRSGHILYTETDNTTSFGAHGYISRAVVNPTTFSAMTMPDDLKQALEKYFVNEETWNSLIDKFSQNR